MELSQRIAELTEDLEELRSERTMLLNQLDCADDKEVKKVKTSVSTMKDTLKNLEAKEVQFSAELDAAQREFASLQEQASHRPVQCTTGYPSRNGAGCCTQITGTIYRRI